MSNVTVIFNIKYKIISLSVHRLTFYFSVFGISLYRTKSLCLSLHMECAELHIIVFNWKVDVEYERILKGGREVETGNDGTEEQGPEAAVERRQP